jgi:thymidylate kinase
VFTVALIGPDGAGKTTVSQRLLERLPLPTKYLYMGVNSGSSNRVLPTTSLIRAIKRACGAKPDVAGPPALQAPPESARGGIRGLVRTVKSLLSLAHRLSEEWYRQLLTWFYQSRGYIVLYDRHYFIDYYAYDIAPCSWRRPLARRIHGYLLAHVYPRPDLVIYLDAPSEVLFARKGEGTIEALERRRREYLEIQPHVHQFVIVDANRPLEQVTRDVLDTVQNYHRGLCREKRGWWPQFSRQQVVAASRVESNS